MHQHKNTMCASDKQDLQKQVIETTRHSIENSVCTCSVCLCSCSWLAGQCDVPCCAWFAAYH
jgi:hypothetical protein